MSESLRIAKFTRPGRKPSFAAMTIAGAKRHTCRLSNATPLRLRELIEQNLEALDRVVTFLARHEILLYRITSNLIPFASHPVNSIRWWEVYAPQLAALGRRLDALGVRVSLHPGQFTVLNSPNPKVVAASVAELAYHARLLGAAREASSRRRWLAPAPVRPHVGDERRDVPRAMSLSATTSPRAADRLFWPR